MLLIFVGIKLFLPNLVGDLYRYFGGRDVQIAQVDELTVVYPVETPSLEVTNLRPEVWLRLVNIYEPLVKVDKDYKIVSSLALSWGLINEKTWEFNLRPNVVFHNGKNFEVKDVVASLGRANMYKGSLTSQFLENIERIEIDDMLTFRIVTKDPDPLLLQKLSLIFIIPENFKDEGLEVPIGTGPYAFSSWENGEMNLVQNPYYWGGLPKFNKVKLLSIEDKSKRVSKLVNNGADLVYFVPYDGVDLLREKGLSITTVPELAVNFLLMNTDGYYLGTVAERRALSYAINTGELVNSLGEFVHTVNQFVSTGIFGFSPKIEDREYDKVRAQALINDAELDGKTIRIHLPIGLELLGEQIRHNYSDLGVKPLISYLSGEDFLKSIETRNADIYYLGYKSDLGDSADFLRVVAHTDGEFNLANFSSEKVDYLIESSFTELDSRRRRDLLQETMEILMNEEFIGVPLFENEIVMASRKWLSIPPRLDGMIYFDELIINK